MLMTIAEKLINEGLEKGLEQGLEQGLEKGLEQGLKMTLTALQAFREGKELEEVMNLTGLERDKLLEIQKQALQ